MLRVIKDGIFILFLLTGILFVKNGSAQIFGGGTNNGFTSSKSGACSSSSAMVVSGGAYDGSTVLISNGCPRTNVPMAGGSNNGFSSSVAGACSTPSAMVVKGGSNDGSVVLISNGCPRTNLSLIGGINNGSSSSVAGACSTPSAMAVKGGSYDGTMVLISNGCPRTNLSLYGGINNGSSSSVAGACSTPFAMSVKGGSYDGTMVLISNGCPRTNLSLSGGLNNGFSSSIASACGSPAAMAVKGGSRDGSFVLASVCISLANLNMSGGINNGFSSSKYSSCGNPSAMSISGGSYDGSKVSASIGCPLTNVSMTGGINNGVSSSISSSCGAPSAMTVSGGSYDGSGLLASIGCPKVNLDMFGGINNGFSSGISSACGALSAMAVTGGSYDGGDVLVSIGCPRTLLSMYGGVNNGFSSNRLMACASPAGFIAKGGSYDGTMAKPVLCFGLFVTSINTTPATCQCNGSATVNASGGNTPYSYIWSSGSTNSSATGLCPGNYYVTLTDANLSQTVGSTTIGQSGNTLSTTVSVVNATCGNNNGSATVSIGAGTPPYNYIWSVGGTSSSISSLAPGPYSVTVSDDGGCTSVNSINITNIPGPSINFSAHSDVSCNGGSNGSATTSLTAGTSPFSYQWNTSPVQTSSVASNLSAGTFSVTVTDANGCNGLASITITEPPILVAPFSSQSDITCNSASDGSITVSPAGGTNPYTYSWSTVPIQTTSTASNLSIGGYSVTVSDAHNCSVVTSSMITQPGVLALSALSNTPVCYGTNMNLSSTVSGGTSGFNYNWTGPNGFTSTDSDPIFNASSLAYDGIYYVTVTDAHNCTATSSTSVSVILCTTILNLKLYISGYYIGSGQMQPTVLNEGVPTATGSETDTLLIELHNISSTAIIEEQAQTILLTDGTTSATFSGTVTGNSYWVVIKHRNLVQTWSANPVLFSPTTNYDFFNSQSQAYGNNMLQVDFSPDIYAFYSGDINQDQNVDLLDFPDMDYGINNGLFGYYNSDLNGDGNVDLLDFPILDANINNGVFSFHP